mgnify:CR=1 FL=1
MKMQILSRRKEREFSIRNNESLPIKREALQTVDKVKRDTRHFAKRQLTWFRREPSVTWVDFSKIRREEALVYMLEQLKEKEII